MWRFIHDSGGCERMATQNGGRVTALCQRESKRFSCSVALIETRVAKAVSEKSVGVKKPRRLRVK